MRFLLMFLMLGLLTACSSFEGPNRVTITQDNENTTICSVVDNDSRSYVKYTKSDWCITDTQISVAHYQPSTITNDYSVQTVDTISSSDNETVIEYRVLDSGNQDVYINVVNQWNGNIWTTQSIRIQDTDTRKQTYFRETKAAQKAINRQKPISMLRHPQL